MQTACYYGLNDQPVLLYLAVIVGTVTMYADVQLVRHREAGPVPQGLHAGAPRSGVEPASATRSGCPSPEPAPVADRTPSPVLATTASES